ncbi:hypothetical protein KIT04_160 [Vibrio phage KIT04]|nr:hypothetical protein KIT04_160 [Vibrio phage KIT04]
MALFMGRKPSDNRPLLHLSSGAESVSQLDGEPIASTLFHSEIPYLAIYDVVTVTKFRKVKSENTSSGWTHYYEPIIPQEVWNYIDNKYIMTASLITHNTTFISHTAVGRELDKETKPYNAFIGNFTGSFPNGIPYPQSPVPNSGKIWNLWHPISNRDITANPANKDQGVAVDYDYTGKWSVSGLQKETTSSSTKPVIYTSPNSTTGARSTTANYTNQNRDITKLFGIRGVGLPFLRNGSSSAPSTITYSASKPSAYNYKLKIYIFNVKYNSQNNVEHVRPDTKDGIKISNQDLVIGNLSMKSGMLISDEAPLERVLDNKDSTSKRNFFNNIISKLSLAQLTDYPFPLMNISIRSNKTWNIDSDWGALQVHAPSPLLGSNITLEFSADEIKYKGSKGEYLIASKSRNYTPYILGGANAITAIFPSETRTLAQLRQGTRFVKVPIPVGGNVRAVYNPNEIGRYQKEVVKQRIPLPPGSTSKNTVTAHISPIYMHGEASSTIGSKKSKMQLSLNGFAGFSNLILETFERSRPEKEVIVGNLAYSVIKDVSLTRHSEGSIGSSYWPQSSTANKMQAIRIQYKVRVNWVRNELELVGFYNLTNAQIRANEGGNWNTYYNKLGERDVTYRIPEVRFGFYVVGTA